jgi:hypothetical protein
MRLRSAMAVSAAVVTMTGAAAQLPPSGFEVGQPFPDLVLPSLEDNAPLSISDFRGQRVILHVFASW